MLKAPRPSNEIYYPETWKMLLRGALFNAPQSLRDKYEEKLQPITLGGRAAPDSIIGELVTKDEIKLLRKIVRRMQKIEAPEYNAEIGMGPVKQYVADILAVVAKYAPRLNYFRDDLQTIAENIQSRKITVDKPTIAEDKTQAYRTALTEMKQDSVPTADEPDIEEDNSFRHE